MDGFVASLTDNLQILRSIIASDLVAMMNFEVIGRATELTAMPGATLGRSASAAPLWSICPPPRDIDPKPTPPFVLTCMLGTTRARGEIGAFCLKAWPEWWSGGHQQEKKILRDTDAVDAGFCLLQEETGEASRPVWKRLLFPLRPVAAS